MGSRIGYLDFLRGIAIITVVMGHIIQYNLFGASATNCFNFIYSFHMGFFFFISGCTASLSAQKNVWESFLPFISKKSRQLLIPFVVWGCIIPLVLRNISLSEIPGQFIQIFRYPDHSAWFLLYLFFIQLIFFVVCAISTKIKSNFCRFLILLCSVPVVVCILYIKNMFIGNAYTWITPEYLLLFILGFGAQTYRLSKQPSFIVPFVCFLLFVVVSPLFDFSESGSMMMRFVKLLSSITFSITTFCIIESHYGAIHEKVRQMIEYLGMHSLELYVTQYCLIQICAFQWFDANQINTIPLFVLVFLASLPICFITIGIANILKTLPGMSLLLYGDKNHK